MLLILGFGALAALIGFAIAKPPGPAPTVNPYQPRYDITAGAQPAKAPSAIETLALCFARQQPFPPELVDAAAAECQRTGDFETYAALQRVFAPPQPTPAEPPSPPEPSPQPLQVVPSPIYGVTDDEWSEYVHRLAIDPVDARSDRYVGKYRHHTGRLTELGIDPRTLQDDASQYQALETDFKDAIARHAKLINDFAGDVIQINGQSAPVTRSGLLTLIKSAGPDGARQWLTDDSERLRFPNTTQRFLSLNGIF